MKLSYSYIAAVLLGVAMLLSGPAGRAQVFSPTTPTRTPAEILADTAERREPVVTPAAKRQKAAADSAKRTERMFRAFGYEGIRLTRPGKAALLAAILPGAGQIYNRRWWKLPLVYGALGTVVGAEVFYQMRYREFVDAYAIVTQYPDLLRSDKLGPQARLYGSAAGIQSGLVYYRGNRDLFYLYCGLAYGLQIVDALVDAHLKDFDVSDDLSLHWQPTLLPVPGQALALPTAPGVSLALRVK
ncbi:DUF5683 domain-containing protein [Hymenobacter properus]|uniref:DUF5683 domain-containing protein n=1 Tax=Hymenobacter properus TaxID=2791026 RepID=A0A931FN33_9BACT|nr:DUF5683 domain-containing protein [Hymenobacter properus]MBF9142244.1 hypothetical protein [Hymenobacter properus]MBR7721051.1 hypothetical protein [Microvirga sp. SRT04]